MTPFENNFYTSVTTQFLPFHEELIRQAIVLLKLIGI